jgi:hypothetical protein
MGPTGARPTTATGREGYPGHHGVIEIPTFSPDGAVLDLDLTALDRQVEFIAIDKQPNDDVVHLDRFRKADRLAHQTLDTCA